MDAASGRLRYVFFLCGEVIRKTLSEVREKRIIGRTAANFLSVKKKIQEPDLFFGKILSDMNLTYRSFILVMVQWNWCNYKIWMNKR